MELDFSCYCRLRVHQHSKIEMLLLVGILTGGGSEYLRKLLEISYARQRRVQNPVEHLRRIVL